MKTPPENRKKIELRDRFLRYVQAHTDERDRIPTVAELREALGVTNYMLLRCMNELIREGQLYRKSRKEGTFLSYHVKKHVIGLIDNSLCGRQYVDDPAWFSGFFRAFTKNTDFILRIVPCRKAPNMNSWNCGSGILRTPGMNLKNDRKNERKFIPIMV